LLSGIEYACELSKYIILQFTNASIQSEIVENDGSKNQESDQIPTSDWKRACKETGLEAIIGSPPDTETIPVAIIKPQRARRKFKPVSYIRSNTIVYFI